MLFHELLLPRWSSWRSMLCCPFLGSPNGQSTVENRAGAGTRSEGAQWLDSDWGIFEGTLFSLEVGELSSGSATSKPCPWASHGPFLDLCSPLKWVDWTLQDDPRPKVPLDSNVLTIPTQIPESACGQGDQRPKRQKNFSFQFSFASRLFAHAAPLPGMPLLTVSVHLDHSLPSCWWGAPALCCCITQCSALTPLC